MEQGKPSRTAWKVAAFRAAHQLLDRPLVLNDPFALPILGEDGQVKLHHEFRRFHGFAKDSARAFFAVRSRFAEDQLVAAVDAGVRQYVVLGAGLDTFACRNQNPQLRVFEVDHPSTQLWKRKRLRDGGIRIASNVTFVPVDFERQDLRERLLESGFDFERPAFVSWLGVVPYLTLDAFRATLRTLGALPAGSGIAFDYGVSRDSLSFIQRMLHDQLARRVRRVGEPLQLLLTTGRVGEELQSAGFGRVEDLGQSEINGRYFEGRTDGLRVRTALGRVVCARR